MRSLSKSLIAAVAALGVISAAATPAAANPLIIAPWALAAIIGGSVVGGAVVGSAVANSAAAPPPSPAVTVTNPPAPGCRWTHARVEGVWRIVQVCD